MHRKLFSLVKTSLVVLTVLLDLLLAVVVLVGVALLVRPGQPVHEIVRRLVRDVAQQSLHERHVVLQLVLDRLPLISRDIWLDMSKKLMDRLRAL